LKQRGRIVGRDAELVDAQARRDVRMAAGVDVRVQPDGDSGHAADAGRDFFYTRQLARGFDVDRLDTDLDGAFEFRRCLTDAR
jgi:hypothetical protein